MILSSRPVHLLSPLQRIQIVESYLRERKLTGVTLVDIVDRFDGITDDEAAIYVRQITGKSYHPYELIHYGPGWFALLDDVHRQSLIEVASSQIGAADAVSGVPSLVMALCERLDELERSQT